MKFACNFSALAAQRNWDKEIDVWIGSTEALRNQLPAGASTPSVEELDLLDLFDEKSLPDSDHDAAQFLRDRLRQRFPTLRPADGRRCMLIVKSVPLLAHFNVGLKEFFDWFCSDRCMVVLVLDGIPEELRLPGEFEFQPRRIVDFLAQPDLAKNVFSAS
ncbi:MAG: hypothetical protein HYY24_03130 [Verrucomicrobia bacterium]|nr:hypothetical protein [Verrucomicrobiota bacterium]